METTITSFPAFPAARGFTQYPANRPPLTPSALVSLPTGAVQARGWIRGQLKLMTQGLTGRLSEISPWLAPDNGWLDGGTDGRSFKVSPWLGPNNGWRIGPGTAWEEQPYWYRGFYELAALTADRRLSAEAMMWMENLLSMTDEDGYWGPKILKAFPLKRGPVPDIWPHMLMLDALTSHHDRTGDSRVIPLMLNFFRWVAALDDSQFLAVPWSELMAAGDAWQPALQVTRSGDMLPHLYWLYNRTGEPFLLDLATRFFSRQPKQGDEKYLDGHIVNFTQRYRYVGNYALQTGDPAGLAESEHWYKLHMDEWGQMPGGIFAADEMIREGKTDPRQGFETCGVGEFCKSFQILAEQSGQTCYADRSEDLLFNTFPATHSPDLKALHYLTACNQVLLDAGSRHDFANQYRQLEYSPFAVYRCCQHNAGMTWPLYVRHLWMAADGDGLAAWMYGPCTVDARVRGGVKVHIEEETGYPFETTVRLTLRPEKPVVFPLYLRVPAWSRGLGLNVCGTDYTAAGPVICVEREWGPGDTLSISFEAQISCRRWAKQKNAVSVDYGPLSYSLRIVEQWSTSGSREWPEYTVAPKSDWNYALSTESITVHKQTAPTDEPWRTDTAPIELRAKGRRLPEWKLRDFMVDPLPPSPAVSTEPEEELTLIPMGCARLRISCFPELAT
jgi:DUF1680 family protein